MHTPTILAGLGLAASATALSTPHHDTLFNRPAKRASAGQNVVYWGQNGGGTVENNDLTTYCEDNAGIDIIVLAFLYEYGNGDTIPSGTIGQSCFIATSGEGQDCDALATAIQTCQNNGVKIILSLGGAAGSYTLASDTEAETIGQYLWDSYGNSGSTTVERPFGDVFVNGFDFDIEVTSGQDYYASMISTLRTAFATDADNTYYITGAPQCPLPEPNMGPIISAAQFDYLWPQFYNNNNYTYPCALPFNGNAAFNYDDWVTFTAGTPSADALLFIGVPASPLAATGTDSGETYYITPAQLAELVDEYETATRFGGIMMWSAGFSDSNVNDDCTYAQEAYEILLTGAACGASGVTTTTSVAGSGTTSSTSTTVATGTTSTTTAVTSACATLVAQWGQCGGEGFTGCTECASGYSCVATSDWWSQCE